MLYFPTPTEWVHDYPHLVNQREQIKSNIIGWSLASGYPMKFIADFLSDEQKIAILARQREKEQASIPKASPAQLAKVARLQQEFRKRLTSKGRFIESFIFIYIPAILTTLALVYVGHLLKPHFYKFW
jgi:hypothetical protein